MNNSHLLHRTQGGPLLAYPLPATFSRPVEFAFSSPNSYVLGPVSHDRTVAAEGCKLRSRIDASKSSSTLSSRTSKTKATVPVGNRASEEGGDVERSFCFRDFYSRLRSSFPSSSPKRVRAPSSPPHAERVGPHLVR